MDVLVTGANGTIGQALRDYLEPESAYTFTWFDKQDHPNLETVVGDTTDRDAVFDAAQGTDAIVHLAMADYLGASPDRSVAYHEAFPEPIKEICYVLEAARENDAKVIYASSNHAVGLYEVRNAPDIYYPDFDLLVDHTVPSCPDSRYGAMKVLSEGMGELAAEVHDVPFYSLRIGAVRGPEFDHPFGDAEQRVERGELERGSDRYHELVARMKALWCSRRDISQLVDRCLQDEDVSYDVFYGISQSDRNWLDIAHAQEVLGYVPEDDAEAWDSPPSS